MRTVFRLGAVPFAVLLLVLSSAGCAHTKIAAKADPRVLYVGNPGSAREKDYIAFLSPHFPQLKTADLAKFDPALAKDSDVVILDYDAEFNAPRPKLPPDYSRATITVGVVGALISSDLGLKTGYM